MATFVAHKVKKMSLRRNGPLLVAALTMSVTLVGVAGGSAAVAPPIKIVTYGDITGLAPFPEHEFQDGVVAAVDAFNASGGVQGRKIDLITCDTKFAAAAAASCVANAKSEGVVAAIPSVSLVDNVTTPLLEQQGIPILGSDPSSPQAEYSKTSACFLPGPYVDYPALVKFMAKAGSKSLSATLPSGVAGENVLEGATAIQAKAVGAKVHIWLQASPTTTDFAPIGEQAVEAGEDGFMGGVGGPALNALFSAVLSAKPGVKLGGPGYILQGGPSVDQALVSLGGKGTIISGYTAFPTDTNVPAVKLFDKEIAKVDPTDKFVEVSFMTWLDGYGATQILKSMTSGPINARTITAAMQHTKNLNMLGAVPNWSYSYNSLGLGCTSDSSEYEGILTSANGATPSNGNKPVYTLPSAVINYYKAHESTLAR
jgi:ABC-type branched-subunit amino acid transport system substrate-binding protein